MHLISLPMPHLKEKGKGGSLCGSGLPTTAFATHVRHFSLEPEVLKLQPGLNSTFSYEIIVTVQ